MNEILYILCCHQLNMIDGRIPYPARKIAEQIGLNLTATRKGLRQLKEQGYVDSTCVYLCADALTSDHEGFPYRGWTITEKTFQTDEYKRRQKKRNGSSKKYLGIPQERSGNDVQLS